MELLPSAGFYSIDSEGGGPYSIPQELATGLCNYHARARGRVSPSTLNIGCPLHKYLTVPPHDLINTELIIFLFINVHIFM